MMLLTIFLACPLLANVAVAQNNSEQIDSLWISKVGKMSDHLLGIQALIVKEEDRNSCAIKKKLSPSDKRYLMCAGSIVTHLYVLTSAYCIHEAITVRHNIKGSLAVMIAPLSNTTQIIKIINYHIHPKNTLDPREVTFSDYNVALLKLSCRILQKNLVTIELPDQSLSDLCIEDNCIIGILSKSSARTYSIFQKNAKNIGAQFQRRNAQNLLDASETLFGDALDVAESKNSIRHNGSNDGPIKLFAGTRKARGNNSTSSANYSKFIRNIIAQNYRKSRDKLSDNSVIDYSLRNKKISVRSTDGLHGCAMTGAAVMADNTQAGLVALSCDDKQPNDDWIYTSISNIVDWIKEVTSEKSGQKNEACSTCTYNFFFNNNNCSTRNCLPNHNAFCQHDNNDLNSGHYDETNKNKPTTEYTMDSYKEAMKEMYLKTVIEKDNDISNNDLFARDINVQYLMRQINDPNSPEQAMLPEQSLETLDNSNNSFVIKLNTDDLEDKIHELIKSAYSDNNNEKFEALKNDGNDIEYSQSENYDLPTEKKKKSVDDYLIKNHYENTSVPVKYLMLYRMFLEEQQKLGNKYYQY